MWPDVMIRLRVPESKRLPRLGVPVQHETAGIFAVGGVVVVPELRQPQAALRQAAPQLRAALPRRPLRHVQQVDRDLPVHECCRRMVQKLDLAENTRYRQAGFEATMATLRGDLSLM
jgi:hypothetical protein